MATDPSWHRRVLADLPAPDAVWAEAEARYKEMLAQGSYAAARFAGLYAQTRGLLEALVAEAERPADT